MGRPRKKKAADLEWYVYNYNDHKNKIEPVNIFRHVGFAEDVDKARKKCKTRDEFMEQVRKELSYYFRWKAEYELVMTLSEDDNVSLSPWVGCRNPEEVAIEADKSDFDWEDFAIFHIGKQIYDNKAKIDIYDQVMWLWGDFCHYVCRELGVE